MDKTATTELIDEILQSAMGVTLPGFTQRREHLLKQQMTVLVCVARSEQQAQDRDNAKKFADICGYVAAMRRYEIALKRTRLEGTEAMSMYAHIADHPR